MLGATGLAIATVFCGCQMNVASLETIVNDPDGKNFGFALTFLQFAFVGFVTLPETLHWRQEAKTRSSWLPQPAKRQLRFDLLCAMSFTFWLSSTINNIVFSLDVSVPIATLFRSSSMVVNLLTGYFFFGKRYTLPQVSCALLITGGLFILTMATSTSKQHTDGTPGGADQNAFLFAVGMVTCLFSAVLSSSLGLMQDYAYSEARQASRGDATSVPRWKEAMMYSHLMTLPLFLATGYGRIVDGLSSLPPELYPYVGVNLLSQLACIRGVYTLTDVSSAFTMTMTITLRKFVSLLVSIFYFGHYVSFGVWHWVAIAMVMFGGPMYPLMRKPVEEKKKKKE